MSFVERRFLLVGLCHYSALVRSDNLRLSLLISNSLSPIQNHTVSQNVPTDNIVSVSILLGESKHAANSRQYN